MWPRAADAHLFQEQTMGTSYHITVVGKLSPAEKAQIQQSISEELEKIDEQMSTYREDSDIMVFNRYQQAESLPLPPALIDVVAISQEISEMSGGAFDITVSPLVNAWGFGPEKKFDQKPREPSELELVDLRKHVGYQKLIVDRSTHTLKKLHPQVTLDLSAIAPGYAVDQIADVLLKRGYQDFLVEIGGEVRSQGRNAEGKYWRIGIEQPLEHQREIYEVVALENEALATSGDYRNYFEADGQRHSHTIDPRTGRPILHSLTSVTVVTQDAARADALATAILVLGPKEGYDFALRNQIAALLIERTPQGLSEQITPAFARLRKRSN